jgi:hypothetical protein
MKDLARLRKHIRIADITYGGPFEEASDALFSRTWYRLSGLLFLAAPFSRSRDWIRCLDSIFIPYN